MMGAEMGCGDLQPYCSDLNPQRYLLEFFETLPKRDKLMFTKG